MPRTFLLGLLLWLPAVALADGRLITELATERVDITASFTGKEILIFGAISRPGQVIIKLVSPHQAVSMSRKTRIGPVWVSEDKRDLTGAPGLFYLLSSAPIDRLLSGTLRDRYRLRLQDAAKEIHFAPAPRDLEEWRTAFLRLKKDEGYYQENDHAVALRGDRLFHASLDLPPKLPLGHYRLEIYLVNDGKVLANDTHMIEVRKVRLEHWVSDIAHLRPWLFGTGFTVMVMLLGFGLGMILRRDIEA